MAYVNEIVSEEEKKVYKIPNYKEISPSFWTINREKNVRLFKYWTNIDKPSEQYFALVWEEWIIKIVLVKKVKVNTVSWDLESIKIPEEILSKKQEVMSELRSALRAFGLFGYNLRNATTVETIVNF